jgi:TetR/AcrR family transcriptional repressor of nem operon
VTAIAALSPLSAPTSRQGPALHKTLTAGVRRQIDRIVSLLKRGAPAARRRRAIATYAGMVGALMLARAVDDPMLAQESLQRHGRPSARRRMIRRAWP